MTSGNFLVRLDKADVALSGIRVLHGIDWEIAPGQHWRVDGANGAGKSTLLKTIAGVLWPVAANPPARLYRFSGHTSHLLAGVRPRLGYASYTMQDEYVRGARNITVFEVLASGFGQSIMIYDTPELAQQQAIAQASQRLELDTLLDRPFLSLSHGQKSAVLFARSVIHQPRLLVLDEIFNGVDIRHFNLMIRELQRYQNLGGQVVLSWHEHGIEQIEQMFTHTLMLEQGRVAYQGVFLPTVGHCGVASVDEHHAKTQIEADKLIALEDIDVYLANKHILKNINWTINCGERWLLNGDNGAGKTTLLKVLLAEVRPAIGGRIWRQGFGQRPSVWQIRALVGYVSPELQQAYRYNISVYDAVASGFFASIGLYDEPSVKQQGIVEDLLERFGLKSLAGRGVHQVSSGQMRRVMIARAMARNPDILLFDEITANLDRPARTTILELIRKLADEGKTMVFVGHHPAELSGLYNRVLVLENGEIARR